MERVRVASTMAVTPEMEEDAAFDLPLVVRERLTQQLMRYCSENGLRLDLDTVEEERSEEFMLLEPYYRRRERYELPRWRRWWPWRPKVLVKPRPFIMYRATATATVGGPDPEPYPGGLEGAPEW